MAFKKFCRECGHDFYADAEWKSVCIHCYKKQKRAEDRVYELEEENAKLRVFIETRLPAMIEDRVDESRLRKLIQLCHPDKHNGSEGANEITQWLLSLRPKQ